MTERLVLSSRGYRQFTVAPSSDRTVTNDGLLIIIIMAQSYFGTQALDRNCIGWYKYVCPLFCFRLFVVVVSLLLLLFLCIFYDI